MPRCDYPKCERIVRDPNRFNLCHVHVDMAEFFVWFSDKLSRMEQLGGRGATVRSSGIIVPPR